MVLELGDLRGVSVLQLVEDKVAGSNGKARARRRVCEDQDTKMQCVRGPVSVN